MNDTAVSQTVIRLAMAMWARDPCSPITEAQRAWVLDRLTWQDEAGHHVPLLIRERAKLRRPLLHYIREHRPEIFAIVTQQFEEP